MRLPEGKEYSHMGLAPNMYCVLSFEAVVMVQSFTANADVVLNEGSTFLLVMKLTSAVVR